MAGSTAKYTCRRDHRSFDTRWSLSHFKASLLLDPFRYVLFNTALSSLSIHATTYVSVEGEEPPCGGWCGLFAPYLLCMSAAPYFFFLLSIPLYQLIFSWLLQPSPSPLNPTVKRHPHRSSDRFWKGEVEPFYFDWDTKRFQVKALSHLGGKPMQPITRTN